MIFVAILVALSIFCFVLALYNYSQRENLDVSKRIHNYGRVRASRRKSRGDFWEDFKNSRYKEWASNAAEYLGNILPKQQYFAMLAEKADLPVSGSEFMVILLGSAAFWLLTISLLTFSLSKGVILTIFWIVMWYVYVKQLGIQRRKDFDAQLGDAIVMMSNAFRAGFTFQQAMDTVSKELPEPISGEFDRALREINLGISLEEALDGISRRMESDDFDLLATAVVIQRQIGGNLTQIFDTIGNTIRDRVKLKREIKVLTAEGVFAGWIVGLLPVVICLILIYMNPHYFDKFMAQSYAKYIVLGCIISELIGAACIKKIIDVKI